MGKMRQKLAEAAALNQLLVEQYPVESKAFGNFVHKAQSGNVLRNGNLITLSFWRSDFSFD